MIEAAWGWGTVTTTARQLLEAFDHQGFAIAPTVLPRPLLASATSAIEAIQEAVDGMPPEARAARLVMERDLSADQRDGRPAEEAGNAIFILGDPPAFDPVFARIAILPDLVEMVRHFLGTSDIRFHFGNVTMKNLEVGSRINWHRDFPNRFMCPERASFLRLMVCLDGMDGDNGATMFVPGSHHLPDDEARAARIADVSVLQRAAVTATCEPGSAVFIHPKVVHGGPANASSRPRRNFVMQWGRADDPIDLGQDNAESLSNLCVAEIERWLE